jgi:hypothetical protein
MEQSQQVLEWQAAAVKRVKIDIVLRVLRKCVHADIPADVEQAIRAAENFDQLDRWLDAALEASSLAEFRRLAGLAAKHNRPRKRSKAGKSGAARPS